MNINKSNLTPLMRQYYEIKNKHPEALLLFQVGDFYEIFFEDAKKASKYLGITLTKRGTDPQGNPIPLCGVPIHVLDQYLTKLVKGGFKVAVCDQIETAKPGRMVKRDVTQVLTPGTLTDTKLLDEKSASYLCVLFPGEHWALFFVEILTGQLFCTYIKDKSKKLLEAELSRFIPDEIVVPDTKLAKPLITFLKKIGHTVTVQELSVQELSVQEFDLNFNNTLEDAKAWLSNYFSNSKINNTNNNTVNIIEKNESLMFAFTLLYSYLKRNNELALKQLKHLFLYDSQDFLMLDASTQRNLELVKNTHDGTVSNSLVSVLDKAVSPMGSRTLKKWLLRPLVKKESIEQRFDAVELLLKDLFLRDSIREHVKKVGDLERVVGRISLRRAQLYDYTSLLESLEFIPLIKEQILVYDKSDKSALLSIIASKISDFSSLNELLLAAINTDHENKDIVKIGFSSELDRLRLLIEKGAQAIIELERQEQEKTGISSLKIRYNSVHGYSIEITKANLNYIPEYYIKTQTLSNRERFTTQELRDLEYDFNRAKNEIQEVEKEIFESIKDQVEKYLPDLKKLSYAISYLDALSSLAEVAYQNSYVRPTFNNNRELLITDGRHPIVESNLENKFIPNSTELNNLNSLWIITGPNMGGKSTYLRQVALISIMAQIGSFVPASKANLFIVDRIFTRIGAADNVSQGKSTFLVEMEETSLICEQATENSLVILDEVGRGTSTYDGLAIAQAVVEHIYTKVKARCLFATHYHELTELTLDPKFEGITSYHAASTKTGDGIVLLHKILPGVATGSFGLEVAKMAQLPDTLIKRAEQILINLNS